MAQFALSMCLLSLTACSNFFQCDKASCPTSGGGDTATTDYAYVSNSSSGPTYVSAYDVSSGTLKSIGATSLGFIPVALTVAPSNRFLYVASAPGATTPGIYLYSIGSTGALSVANGGSALVTDTISSMAISLDGGWLFTLNTNGLILSEYAVSTSGKLTLQANFTLAGTSCFLSVALPVTQTCSVSVAPSGNYVAVSLGASGDAVLSFSSLGGITGSGFVTIPSGTSIANPTGDFSIAMDANDYAFIARTNSFAVYSITSSGYTGGGSVAYTAGYVPRSVTLSKNYNYVYTANEGVGTISGFGISGNGALQAISGSPFPGPMNVAALGVDSTGQYMVAAGYDTTAGVQLYSVDSTGVLTQVAEAGSGTSTAYPALVAMTH